MVGPVLFVVLLIFAFFFIKEEKKFCFADFFFFIFNFFLSSFRGYLPPSFPLFTSIFPQLFGGRRTNHIIQLFFLNHEHLHCDTCWTCAMGFPLARRQGLQHAPHHFPGKKVQNQVPQVHFMFTDRLESTHTQRQVLFTHSSACGLNENE